MEESYFDVVFTTVKDQGSYSLDVSASLILINVETDEEKLIGYANLYIFNEYMVCSWDELIDNADSISGDVQEVVLLLYKAKDNEDISGLIAVLDYIEINKEYRGMGYCSKLIDNIIEHLRYINANYIGVIPARIYDNKVVQNEDKAINFYISKGFKPISRRVGGNVIMGKSLL